MEQVDGTICCAGLNSSGQLCRNVSTGTPSTPNFGPIDNLEYVAQWTATENSFHAIATNGIYYNAGDNTYGQLCRNIATGTATATNFDVVPGILDATFVAASNQTTAVFTKSGCKTAGNNNSGQLCRNGNSGTATATNLADCENLSDVSQIVMTPTATFVRKHGGKFYNCGENVNNSLLRDVATGSATATNWGQLSWISSHIEEMSVNTMQPYPETGGAALMRTSDGVLLSFGSNANGQLGRVTETATDLVPAAIDNYPA